MSIPRVDLLIKDSRIASLSKDYGETYGIGQDFFVVALNKANLVLQTHMIAELSEAFVTYKEYDITESSEYVEQPDNIFAPNYIYEVRYKAAGSDCYDEPLEAVGERGDEQAGAPEAFFLDEGRIYLDPVPSSGTLRVRYEKRIERLDYRRGRIASTTGTLPSLETITLEDDEYLDTVTLATANLQLGVLEYVCVVDYRGTILMRNIPIEGTYDIDNRTLTVVSGFEAEDDETIPDGAYITFGADATTHSSLPDIAELFFIQFIQDEVNDLLSSDDRGSSNAKQSYYLAKISEIYSLLPHNARAVPSSHRRG
jgi:hypothetical protein